MRNPIDRFILARLDQQGLKPSPEAEKTTLIRRAYLDLIGLLPRPDEVDTFLEDTRSDAYERLIDELLGSPHYGERWGTPLARSGPLRRFGTATTTTCPARSGNTGTG